LLRGRGPFPICVLGLQAEALEWDGGLRLDQSGREFDDELIEQLKPIAGICRRMRVCKRQSPRV
jgi:hypothetical protein